MQFHSTSIEWFYIQCSDMTTLTSTQVLSRSYLIIHFSVLKIAIHFRDTFTPTSSLKIRWDQILPLTFGAWSMINRLIQLLCYQMSRISKHMKWFIRDLFNLLFCFPVLAPRSKQTTHFWQNQRAHNHVGRGDCTDWVHPAKVALSF